MRRVRQNSTSKYPVHYPSPPVTPEDSDPYMYPPVVRGRSMSKDDASKDAGKAKEKSKTYARSDSFAGAKSRHMSGSGSADSPDKMNVDIILNRHACRLLSSYRLFDLACFAANLDDYQLVSWLRKERLRSAKVDDFVSALRKLHDDFHWPLPILSLSALRHISSVASLESHSSSMEQISQRSKVDANDVCNSSSDKLTPNSTIVSDSEIVQTRPEDGSLPPAECSDAGSLLEEVDSIDSSTWSDALCLSELDHLSVELVNRGPSESDLRLRYLFQILVEAGCLEWSALVSMILRDSVLFLRVVTIACLPDTSYEAVVRLRNGLTAFETWTNSDCPGYRPFQLLLQPHAVILKDIKPQTSSSLSSSTSSAQRGNMTKGSSLDDGSSSLNRNSDNDMASPLKCNREGADSVEMSRADQENSSEKGCVVS